MTPLAGLLAGAASVLVAIPAQAEGVEAIVVTAQKREQRLDAVGLTVTVASGATLARRGVSDIGDLAKIVPGFTATQSPYSTPVYTLRGIGLFDYGFGSTPSVAVYVDEFSRPVPVTQMGLTLDLERVEVMKGPQGTLYGASSTGGAINFIAAKPTDTPAAGLDLGIERFGKAELGGFVSGPLSETLKARLSAKTVQGGAWQRSVSRPDDRNGDTDQLMARLILDWQPAETLRFQLNVNGMRDRSDTQQAQFSFNQLNLVGTPTGFNPYEHVDPAAFAAITDPSSPNYDPSFLSRQATVFGRLTGLGSTPGATIDPSDPIDAAHYLGGPMGNGASVPNRSRLAEWGANTRTDANQRFWQLALRSDITLADDITLTALTSYQQSRVSRYFDNDTTLAVALDEQLSGSVRSFAQELRLAGRSDRFNWIAGANFDRTKSADTLFFNLWDVSLNEVFPGMRFNDLNVHNSQTISSTALFASADYKLTPRLTLTAGARHTENRRTAYNCNSDPYDPAQPFSRTFGNPLFVPGVGYRDLQTAFGLDPAGHRVVRQGECTVLNDLAAPGSADYLRPIITPWKQKLNERNFSFRIGLDYKTDAGTLLYATVSQGYKAGTISGVSASTVSQFLPAKQERLIAYEAGIKAPLFGRKLQLNLAAFRYDYRDKQLRARIRDDIFGLLEVMVNVPRSSIRGFEAELVARPLPGLDISASGSFLHSRVTRSFDSVGARPLYNQAGYTGDFKGSPLTFTPKFSGVFDAQYEAPLTGRLSAFLGGTATYSARDNTTFHNRVLNADGYWRRSHLLIDLRTGLVGPDGAWRLSAYGRNITNKYYETSIFTGIEVGYRHVGRPRTYGLQLSLRTG